MGIYIILFFIYFISFIIVISISNKRFLFAILFMSSIIISFAIYSVLQEDSIGVIFVLGFLYVLGSGLISGFITHILFFFIVNNKPSKNKKIAIGFFGFILLPTLYTMYIAWNQWERRIPTEACMKNKQPITINGSVYYLPPAKQFTIRTNTDTLLFLQFNKHIRKFCDLSKSKTLHVINLSIKMPYDIESFCRDEARLWGNSLCSTEKTKQNKFYPVKAYIFSTQEFDYRRMLAIGFYSDIAKELENAKDVKKIGVFNRYNNRYWVINDESWKNEEGEPFYLNCYDTKPGSLYCRTSYILKTGVGVSYDFRTSLKDLKAVSKLVDNNFRQIVIELTTSPK
jgi:hypothetical protein